ncbi:hypothetical protein CF123_18050 [Aeromonas veronii]|uniref:Uncharacterized protein n=1 Tax=Aeromonas veronii TaxID=654 RepID=A0AAX2UP23_AERVE|nr:hypothetical protein [Aeromonas veronii]TND52021.1 hypothetical protein CF123_18050 [Aeromonas veronii]
MGGEYSSVKEVLRLQLLAARHADSPSVLDGLELVEPAVEEEPAEATPESGADLRCTFCEEGLVKGLFGKDYECAVCHGTGFDLSKPVAVIKYLLGGGRKLRKHYNDLRRESREFRDMWSPEEIKARKEAIFCEKHSSRFD